MQYAQCFICREWSHMGSKSIHDTWLCLPCYIDVLEVRQARGGLRKTAPMMVDQLREGPDQSEPPSPFAQLDLFQ